MKNKQRYYRTAALLGPHTQQVAVRPRRRPIHLRVRIPWRVLAPILAVVAIGLWVGVADLWYLMPDDLSVTGVGASAAQAEIMEAADLLGRHCTSLRPHEAEALVVEQMAYVKDANIRCSFLPARCTIAVTQREPVMMWVDGETVYGIDAEGVSFVAQQAPADDLPTIWGPLPAEMAPHSLMAVMEGVASLTELGLSVDGLEYNPQRGLIWVDSEGRRIAFGVGPEMETRWRVYGMLLEQLQVQGVFPWTMDVRFPGGVTYSLERSW